MTTSAFPNIISNPPGSYSYSSVDLGLDDAGNEVDSGADDHTFFCSGREALVVFNSTGAPITLTITSVASVKTGRSASSAQQDISIPAGETHILGPYKRDGWADASNLVTIQASATGLRAAVVSFPTSVF